MKNAFRSSTACQRTTRNQRRSLTRDVKDIDAIESTAQTCGDGLKSESSTEGNFFEIFSRIVQTYSLKDCHRSLFSLSFPISLLVSPIVKYSGSVPQQPHCLHPFFVRERSQILDESPCPPARYFPSTVKTKASGTRRGPSLDALLTF